jgi:hypothetical protein
MEPYGAQRSQSVAIGGKWAGPQSRSGKRKPLPAPPEELAGRGQVLGPHPGRPDSRSPTEMSFRRGSSLYGARRAHGVGGRRSGAGADARDSSGSPRSDASTTACARNG